MNEKPTRGFASMDPERHRAIAIKGGKSVQVKGRAHQFTSETVRAAGRIGGMKVAANREHMAEIGRKGGAVVSADRAHMSTIGSKGGAKVAEDKAHMAEIGTLGGEARAANTYHG